MKTVLVLGATSAIVQQTIKHFAAQKANLILVGRKADDLKRIADDMLVRGATSATIFQNNLSTIDSAKQLFDQIPADIKHKIDLVYIGYGMLPSNEQSLIDAQIRSEAICVNLLSVIEHTLIWYHYFAAINFEENKNCCRTIAVISSVAGLRGRRTNIIYGTAKGGLNTFLSALRSKGTLSGIRVMTILPGFVDTPMTDGFKKGPLFASAESVGKTIFNAIQGSTDVLYVPWFWRIIMTTIAHIPEKIFKKLTF
jgi:decaprenylphospho-beta-D-erythro-pentofuranosid-2-ulose 2-reductase